MNDTVEIKLRYSNELMEWKDRTVHTTFRVIPGNHERWVEVETRLPLSEYVAKVAKEAGAVEARWNWEQSQQGHYQFV